MVNVEELPPRPFLACSTEIGLPTRIRDEAGDRAAQLLSLIPAAPCVRPVPLGSDVRIHYNKRPPTLGQRTMNRYPMFSPQLLVSFVAVAETSSFTRAADRVSLSQSTVSQQVRRLEELLGKALFERTSHEVRLTEEGIKLLGYARRIIALNEEAHDALTGPWRDGVLRLGMPEDFTVPTVDLLAAFKREHPHLRLDVTSGLSPDLHRALPSGRAGPRARQAAPGTPAARRAAGAAAVARQRGTSGHRTIAGAARRLSGERALPRGAVPDAGRARHALARQL
jgi:DNA-binding MarR family transcriptional regulator